MTIICPDCGATQGIKGWPFTSDHALTQHRKMDCHPDRAYGLSRLARILEPVPWMADANCRGMDADLFHPDKGQNPNEARAVCDGCVVRDECLTWALDNQTGHNDYGVWGGTTPRERRRIRKARRMEVA